MLRTWRTTVLIFGGAAAVVAIDWWSIRPTSGLQAAVVGAITVVIIVRNEPLWAMRVSDRRFVDAFAAIRLELRDLRERIGALSSSEYARQFAAITERLARLRPPCADFAALQADTVADLRLRLDRLSGKVSNESVDLAARRWDALEARFAELVRNKTSFWLLWPWQEGPESRTAHRDR
jgi:hypothetical protein